MTDYDRDQAAIDWARAKIQRRYDFAAKAEATYQLKWQDAVRSNSKLLTQRELHDTMMRWRRIKNFLQMWFIGGEGCVVADFDVRRPHMMSFLDHVEEVNAQG